MADSTSQETLRDEALVLADVIQRRKTLKVLADAENPVSLSPETVERNAPLLLEALRVSGWAPFHVDRGEDGIAEPWRAYVLQYEDCRNLAPQLFQWFPDLPASSKIPRMLYACGALVLVTWIPQFYHLADRKPGQITTDEEHLAATAAMVQNLLLLLTAQGMGTYWSSGGNLGSQEFFQHVGIPTGERLSAAVFVEYPETLEQSLERLPGKHRNSRSDRWIQPLSITPMASDPSKT